MKVHLSLGAHVVMWLIFVVVPVYWFFQIKELVPGISMVLLWWAAGFVQIHRTLRAKPKIVVHDFDDG